jgi:hypothetical protein
VDSFLIASWPNIDGCWSIHSFLILLRSCLRSSKIMWRNRHRIWRWIWRLTLTTLTNTYKPPAHRIFIYYMREQLSENTKDDVVHRWLQGDQRDKIASSIIYPFADLGTTKVPKLKWNVLLSWFVVVARLWAYTATSPNAVIHMVLIIMVKETVIRLKKLDDLSITSN